MFTFAKIAALYTARAAFAKLWTHFYPLRIQPEASSEVKQWVSVALKGQKEIGLGFRAVPAKIHPLTQRHCKELKKEMPRATSVF